MSLVHARWRASQLPLPWVSFPSRCRLCLSRCRSWCARIVGKSRRKMALSLCSRSRSRRSLTYKNFLSLFQQHQQWLPDSWNSLWTAISTPLLRRRRRTIPFGPLWHRMMVDLDLTLRLRGEVIVTHMFIHTKLHGHLMDRFLWKR